MPEFAHNGPDKFFLKNEESYTVAEFSNKQNNRLYAKSSKDLEKYFDIFYSLDLQRYIK